jgi:hypothetical protein
VIPGEELEFEVTALGMTAMVARAWVNEKPGEDGTVAISLRARATGLVGLIRNALVEKETALDPSTGFPRRYLTYAEVGSKQRRYTVVFGPRWFRYRYWRNHGLPRASVVKVPDGGHAHDLHSLALALRAWRPNPGKRARLYAAVGRRLWRIDVVYGGPDTIIRDQVPTRAIRLAGEAYKLHPDPDQRVTRSFKVWLSNDERRVPLRARVDSSIGMLGLELTSYRAAADSEPDQREDPVRRARP